MKEFLIFTNTAGTANAATIDEARQVAADFCAPEWDRPRIFHLMDGCGDCTCGGQIHPASAEVE